MENQKDIPGYEGIYYATIDGRIFRHECYLPFGNNIRKINRREKIQSRHTQGYKRVVLSKNQIDKNHLVHRLIAKTFLPNPYNKQMVNHKDGNKHNNHVSNLEWVTRAENEYHAKINGLKPKHEKNGASKISDIDAEYIRKNYIPRKCVGQLAKMFGITTHQVRRIAVGDSRKLNPSSGG